MGGRKKKVNKRKASKFSKLLINQNQRETRTNRELEKQKIGM